MIRTEMQIIEHSKIKDALYIKAFVDCKDDLLLAELACILRECYLKDANSTLLAIDDFMDFVDNLRRNLND